MQVASQTRLSVPVNCARHAAAKHALASTEAAGCTEGVHAATHFIMSSLEVCALTKMPLPLGRSTADMAAVARRNEKMVFRAVPPVAGQHTRTHTSPRVPRPAQQVGSARRWHA